MDLDIYNNVFNYKLTNKNKVLFNYKLNNTLFNLDIINYYMSDIFCKNSKLIGLCASKIKFSNFKN